MQKNEILTGIVTSLGYNGEGIIKEGEYTVFVPFTLVGEKVIYKVLKVHKNLVYGKLQEVLTPSQYRTRENCGVYTKCGGCQLQHLIYTKQLKFKSEMVEECFKKIAGIDIKVPLTVKSDLEYNYRNKLQLPVRRDKNGVQIGFYALNSHRIVEVDNCPLHPNWSSKIITAFKEYITKVNEFCYNEEDNKGSLRHIVVREIKDELIITAVVFNKLKNTDTLLEILKTYFKHFSLYINENKQNNNVILGDKFTLIHGKGYIKTCSGGINFNVGPESFLQINSSVKTKLYNDIKRLAQGEDTTIIDAYSGVGQLTAQLAKRCNFAYGIEIIQEAVNSANDLALKNDLSHKTKAICGKVEDVLPNLLKEINTNLTVVVDPPRKGVDKQTLKAILNSGANKIIYCSCSPQTLARDVGILLGKVDENGKILKETNSLYQITYIQPYDMFPQTKHVESVVCLTKK